MIETAAKRSIGSLTSWLSGGTPSRSRADYWSGDIPWISAFTLKGAEVGDSDQHLTAEAVAVGSKMAPLNATLLLVRGSALHNEIRAGLVVSPVAFNQDVKALVPKSGVVPKYLTHAIRGNESTLLKLVTSAGNTAGVLDTKVVQSFEIYFPAGEEQSEIVRVLDDIDSLVASLEKLIVKKRAIKQGMMQELLTGKTRLPGSSGEWQSKKLSDLLTYEQPGRYLVSNNDYVKTGVPVLTAGKTFILGYTTETDGIYEALPVIIFDDFTTASKYVSFPFKAKSSAMKMLSAKPDVDLRFVFERMQQIDFVAVDHKRRWISEFSKLEIAMPTIEEQHAIASVIEDADDEIEALKRRLKSVRAIKHGMVQELLTGRIRLASTEVAA